MVGERREKKKKRKSENPAAAAAAAAAYGLYIMTVWCVMRGRNVPCAAAGADIISVHAEGASTIHLHRTVNMIKDLGCKAGVVLNPGTPPEVLDYVIEEVDLILVMSVNPGFGGQSFIESQVEKIAKIKAMCDAKGVNPWIEVDGGVSPANAYKVIDAGANALVAGSAVFNSPDYAAAIAGIKASKAPK